MRLLLALSVFLSLAGCASKKPAAKAPAAPAAAAPTPEAGAGADETDSSKMNAPDADDPGNDPMKSADPCEGGE